MEENGKRRNESPRWTRRKLLVWAPLGMGALALIGKIRLSFKGKTSNRVADHWESVGGKKS